MPNADVLTLEHPRARVLLEPAGAGRTRVRVESGDPSILVQGSPWTTGYPPELVEAILRVKGPDYVCDELRRDEEERYVQLSLRWALFAYVPPDAFAGKRLLDFGCGCGASSCVLARMLPDTDIVGVELEPAFLEVARRRAAHFGRDRLRFMLSASGDALPDGLGRFDFVVLSAVFEHLLPAERATVVAQLWSLLEPGGVLFLNQTPGRWYLHEPHTTGLPGLNFLPDSAAGWLARRFSPRVRPEDSWDVLLRKGIRGGSQREVLRILRAVGDGRPLLLRPSRLGVSNRVDLWYRYSTEARASRLKPIMRAVFKAITHVTGTPYTPALDLAIAKAAT